MRLSIRTVATLSLALLAAGGCGDSGDDAAEEGRKRFEAVFSDVKGLRGEERERKLLGLAKKEGGELSLYTSLTDKTEAAVADAFEDAFDIEVAVYRGQSEAVAQRVSEESKAGFRGADVVETNGSELAALAEQGVFVPYRPEAASGLREGSLHEDWTASRQNKFVVAWNTKLVSKGRQPRKIEDLARPEWKGKVALEQGDADWYKTLREHWVEHEGKTAEEADRLFESIARNSRVVASHAVMAQLLAAGEYAVAATNYIHLTRDSIDDGAPVELMPLARPVVSRPQGVGLLETARHPATAVLFEEWLLSDGQKVLQESNLEPARTDLLEEGSGADEVLVDVEAFLQEADEWDDRYEELLRLGRAVGGDG